MSISFIHYENIPKKLRLFTILSVLPLMLTAQIGYNFSQINYNTLLINPGYTGNTAATSFQTSYRGIVGGAGIDLPRTVNFSLHAPFRNNERLGWGGMMEVYRVSGVLNFGLQPSFAYQIELSENERLALGTSVRMNYYTYVLDPNIVVDDQRNVLTAQLGLGAFYYKGRFFAGLGTTNLAHRVLSRVATNNAPILEAQPLYLHSGLWWEALKLMKLKTAILLNRSNYVALPDRNAAALPTKWDITATINAIFSDQYWFGGSLGRVYNDAVLGTVNYFNLSAVYTFNLARVSYTYQAILDNRSNIALNTTHVILLEFDIVDGGNEKVTRYY